ncbi:MAG: T9SS type A sorting domain-containing protein [Dysgonamonadaceae bacterium]|jgi:ligand-binding sensor domain-containing protein|nr:T9SS type A sorting domain-containing protein [Dysgonamonadaceae bacterium]
MKTIIFSWKEFILCFFMMILPIIASSQSGDWTSYDGKEMISSILKDGKNLWIAANSGLLQLNTETEAVTAHELSVSDLPRLRNLAKDSEGNLWVTTQRDGVVKYDGKKIVTQYKESNSGLSNNQYCNAIVIDANNNKWIGTLCYLNMFDGKSWQAWTTPQSMIAAYWFVSDLKFDSNGDLWMAGSAPEWNFAKFTDGEIQPFPEITKSVKTILIDKDNNKWLASMQGLVKYDGKEFVTWNTENSVLPANDIYDIKQDASGNMWLACSKYLVQFDGREFTVYPSPLDSNNGKNFIYCLELDDSGNIWLGSKLSGLFKFTPSQGIFQHILDSPTAISAVLDEDNSFAVRNVNSKLLVDILLTDAASVSLSVLDLQGREVATLLKNSYLSKGSHQYSANLTSGVYLVRYIADNKSTAKKIIIK